METFEKSIEFSIPALLSLKARKSKSYIVSDTKPIGDRSTLKTVLGFIVLKEKFMDGGRGTEIN